MATKTQTQTSKTQGNKASKVGVAVVVALVAGAAGYGSYDHQVALAMANGWHGLAARLFPVMPDGMMVVGGVAMLLPKITRNTRAWMRAMSGTGLAITMYANVITGIPFGVDGMILASVPAVVLFLSTEGLFRIVRDLNRMTGQKATPGVTARFLAWNKRRINRNKAAARRNAAKATNPRHGYRTTGDVATA